MVAGKSPAEIEKDLITRYGSQLVSKEVTVTVVSASFPVYVTGSVLHPGKIISNRPISALEAIMEAGGVNHASANLKAVAVIRYEGQQAQHFTLNLKDVLHGGKGEPFYLKPSDIVYVPEKFTWF
jgi:protein involved in polysaccharide export with SLBB domain